MSDSGRQIGDCKHGGGRTHHNCRECLAEGVAKDNRKIEQTLGKALGYPWFKDDQQNFPGATEAAGVCVGEHVPVTLALEAAKRIAALEKSMRDLLGVVPRCRLQPCECGRDDALEKAVAVLEGRA